MTDNIIIQSLTICSFYENSCNKCPLYKTDICNNISKNAFDLIKRQKEEIKKHPILGAQEILKPINCVSNIIPIIEQHHENWDGSGYPNGIYGTELPLIAKILHVADVYDALVSDRLLRRDIRTGRQQNISWVAAALDSYELSDIEETLDELDHMQLSDEQSACLERIKEYYDDVEYELAAEETKKLLE